MQRFAREKSIDRQKIANINILAQQLRILIPLVRVRVVYNQKNKIEAGGDAQLSDNFNRKIEQSKIQIIIN